MRLRTRTIRLRLTLIYGGVFLVSAAALLTIGYLLVRHNLARHHSFRDEVDGLGAALYRELFGKPPATPNGNERAFQAGYHQAVAATLHRLLLEYIAALVVMTGISVALGWWIAGRALAPLRAITATARRVSGENLGERIALQGPEDELKELADTFDGMLTRLDSAFASQKHFVANASHELRTPLAIMRTEIDVALADPHASVHELRAMGEAVRETVDRSESLIAALLLLARSEGVHAHEEPIDLAELAAGCITDLHRGAEAAGITITTDLEPAVARGDSALLERMLANLVENGIRHNRPGGELHVSTSTAGGVAEVVVSNGGVVIDPDRVHALTEPFRRLSRTSGGFGLGLSIVRSVAEVHGGTVELTAPSQGGLHVRVRIPSAPTHAGASRRRRTLTKS
ncbi:MAG TPA: HAMP domain-containing sensor histidine kinase [Solirubrobacteraceae bacterium]|jgi:signal transduction histidine kinase|nr:HAMP domain-containing sensor histidine kinase [Solirubrobacteraceae bacterium]